MRASHIRRLFCTLQAKIESIAREMYHASGVEYLPQAEAQVWEQMQSCRGTHIFHFVWNTIPITGQRLVAETQQLY
jgi:formyltetrahydrofolate synthetase